MVNSMFQWLTISIFSLLHPFYVSVIDINHNIKDNNLELSIRIFTSDLEQTLQNKFKTKLDISNPKDKNLLDQEINNYITEKIKISLNGQATPMHYLGHEIQMESVWIYTEIPKVTQLKKLDINCNLLYDFKELQSNIIHIKSHGIEKSYKLDFPKTYTSFEF